MNQPQLTIFYDGQCPMCGLEMAKLKKHDTDNQIELVDLHSESFQEDYPNIDFQKAMAVLHGYYQGKTLLGLEVSHRAWTLVGKGIWVAPLNWPIIKQVSHWIYLIVARYRHPISNFLYKRVGIGRAPCDEGCSLDKSKTKF